VAGVAVGCGLTAALVWGLTGDRAEAADGAMLLMWCVGIAGICGLACIAPTVGALRVEPAEALSAES
jgi:hypothetical protein